MIIDIIFMPEEIIRKIPASHTAGPEDGRNSEHDKHQQQGENKKPRES